MWDLRWCAVFLSRPRVYRVRDFGFDLPLMDGGTDWFGLRFGPWWLEWCPSKTRN